MSYLGIYILFRGNAMDYDNWENMGAHGWNYQNCLPYFKKAQTHNNGGNDYRGDSGPLRVTRGTSGNELHDVFIEAGQQAGHAFSDDLNGYRQEGVGYFEMTIYKGQRWSAASAYLRPALKDRPDRVSIESSVLVHKVLFDGSKAIGVEFSDKSGAIVQKFADEVILSGGAINSPQLLMLSGKMK